MNTQRCALLQGKCYVPQTSDASTGEHEQGRESLVCTCKNGNIEASEEKGSLGVLCNLALAS